MRVNICSGVGKSISNFKKMNTNSFSKPGVWLNGCVFVYELTGCGFEPHKITVVYLSVCLSICLRFICSSVSLTSFSGTVHLFFLVFLHEVRMKILFRPYLCKKGLELWYVAFNFAISFSWAEIKLCVILDFPLQIPSLVNFFSWVKA